MASYYLDVKRRDCNSNADTQIPMHRTCTWDHILKIHKTRNTGSNNQNVIFEDSFNSVLKQMCFAFILNPRH